jgi:hypothetical protein
MHIYAVKISAMQQQLMDVASLIKETSEKSTPLIDFTHSINKSVLYLENNNGRRMSEEILRYKFK